MSTATPAVCQPRSRRPRRRWQTGRISDDTELRAAWTAVVGDGPEALAGLDDVVARHREPHRRYHGVRHVTWVVRHVHELLAEVPVADAGAVIAAAFFHDAVYDPRADDNEERSAQLAERVLAGLGWEAARCAKVGRLVRATASHAPTDDPETAVLLDADLAVLGAEPAAYQAYVTGVRAEYAHLDDAAWREGRSAVLRSLLGRTPLYSTEPARRRWGARAAANMTAELAALAPR
jgi:predicted metal-dependent HD superfamily phosphohydrolase